MRLRLRLLVLSALCTACMPHVTHAPRVEPGMRYFIGASLLTTPELQEEQITVMPTLLAGGNRGWVSESGMAASLGVQLPVFVLPFVLLDNDRDIGQALSVVLLDGYVQPRRAARGIDYGVGSMLSTGMVAPYVQAGRSGNRGLYTTQLLAYTYRDLNPFIYWMPSVAARSQRPDASRAVDYYASAFVGWERDTGDFRSFRRREWGLSIGIVAEFRGKQ